MCYQIMISDRMKKHRIKKRLGMFRAFSYSVILASAAALAASKVVTLTGPEV